MAKKSLPTLSEGELIDRYLRFYEDLRLKRRSAKTQAQRQFQEVAWGKAIPVTAHEIAYTNYLKANRLGPFEPVSHLPHIDDLAADYPVGAKPIPLDMAKKWDERFLSGGFDPDW